MKKSAETWDRTGDLQIFGLTLSQLSYRGSAEKGREALIEAAFSLDPISLQKVLPKPPLRGQRRSCARGVVREG